MNLTELKERYGFDAAGMKYLGVVGDEISGSDDPCLQAFIESMGVSTKSVRYVNVQGFCLVFEDLLSGEGNE